MADEKKAAVALDKELGHELAASGDSVVVEDVGTDADRHDMYRMGKVQLMQVSLAPRPVLRLLLRTHGNHSASFACSLCSASQ